MVLKQNGTEKIIKTGDQIPLGSKITIRLVVHASEAIDFVHIKDLSAAGFETIYQTSGYQYSGSNSYYRSHRDWASHFFFDAITAGTHIIEYDVLTNNMGRFSSGITTIMSMYAPEFSHHTTANSIEIVNFNE
jgi:uncharacterized protein YfaS (alpha-2-macroglobulin family)